MYSQPTHSGLIMQQIDCASPEATFAFEANDLQAPYADVLLGLTACTPSRTDTSLSPVLLLPDSKSHEATFSTNTPDSLVAATSCTNDRGVRARLQLYASDVHTFCELPRHLHISTLLQQELANAQHTAV